MTRTMIITDIPFWNSGAGHIARLKLLVNFLTKHSFVTVVFFGKKPHNINERLLPGKLDIVFLENDSAQDKEKNVELIKKLFEFQKFKLCIIEYIHNSYFLKSVPDEVVTVLDVHDIISDRNDSFNSLNYPNWDYSMSRDQEYRIFGFYDYVMFVSPSDLVNSRGMLDAERIIVAPHPAVLTTRPKRNPKSIAIGFVASDYLPNVDSICWFLEKVWPKIPISLALEIHIYGAVCRAIPQSLIGNNVLLKGFQKDLKGIYARVDIVINPVRIGAGLKIKNMEALANGLPLVTTLHGASGIENGIGSAFFVADGEEDFLRVLLDLAQDGNMRESVSASARNFIKENFSEDKCFSKLKEILEYVDNDITVHSKTRDDKKNGKHTHGQG